MPIKFENIEVGSVLYDRHRHKVGRAGVIALGEWSVKILSVDANNRTALVSVDAGFPQQFSERLLVKLSTWSMNDPDVKKILGDSGQVIRVRKLVQKGGNDHPR